MKTVRLDEILRQRDPELKQAVEQLVAARFVGRSLALTFRAACTRYGITRSALQPSPVSMRGLPRTHS
jgi:hypothetical protein